MYIVDELDSVAELVAVPSPKSGDGPIVFADGDIVVLSYDAPDEPPYHPTTAPLAIVRFTESYVHFSGPPLYYSGPAEEEVLVGHPLVNRGLFQNGVFRVDRSSLVRHFERMTSVHPSYISQPRFDGLTHYIFTFFDSTFECIARSLDVTVENCGLDEEHSRMLVHLDRE